MPLFVLSAPATCSRRTPTPPLNFNVRHTLAGVARLKFIFCLTLALPLSASAYVSNASSDLTQVTACMLKALKTIPGVSQEVLGEAKSHGTTRPFIEYRAEEETRWEQPTRFTLQPSNGSRFWFMAMLPGLVAPGSDLDLHITNVVVKKWKTQCGVEADVLTI